MNPTPSFARTALALAAMLGSLTLAAPQSALAQAAAPAAAASAPVPTLRPEVAKPLAAAQELLKAGNAKDAVPKLAEAEAVPNLTSYETYFLRRLKGPAQFSTGDVAGALATFEAVLPMAEMPAADKPTMLATTAKLALQLKDFPKTVALIKRYLADGGTDADLQRIYPQVLEQVGDTAGALAEQKKYLAKEEAAGRAPNEQGLRRLAALQNDTGDKAGYHQTVERLALSTGKPDYWGMVINQVLKTPGFADERLRLDVYRLRRAAGFELQAGEVSDMAYRAQQAGLPAEAQAVIEEAYASKLLGSGPDAAADQKLRESINKSAAQDKAGLADAEASAPKAKDGNALFNLGFAVSGAGAHDKALALMAAGVAKGGLRRPDDAALHLAVAQWRAGKTDDAQKTLATVQGNDGTAELARVWSLLLKAPKAK